MSRSGRPLSLQSVLVLKRAQAAQAAQAARRHAEASPAPVVPAHPASRRPFSFGSILGSLRRSSNDDAEVEVRKRAA